MSQTNINRLIVTALCCLMSALALQAQEGLNIAGAFASKYRDMPDATETILTRKNLRDVSLSLYHGITVKKHPELAGELEAMVARDGAKALNKEVRYASGHLYYGFYSLPARGGLNRYILYLNTHLKPGGDKIMLLYLEGRASVDDVKRLIDKNSKN